MAQKVRIILEDDLDGGPADETIRFGLDGAPSEIDLSSANAARRVQGTATQRTRAPRGTAAPVKRNPETAAIREWAKANGHKVSDRGRIHQDIQDAYYEAMKAQD